VEHLFESVPKSANVRVLPLGDCKEDNFGVEREKEKIGNFILHPNVNSFISSFSFIYTLAVPGMRCNASRKPPSRSTSHEVR
jgi:hypothetical protein